MFKIIFLYTNGRIYNVNFGQKLIIPYGFLKKTFTILFLLTCSIGYSQDLVYTQSFGSPIYLNPAFTGNLAKTSFYVNARQQWPSVSGGYVSSSFSANHRLDQINSGIGIIIKSDEEGSAEYHAMEVSGIYSYILHLDKRWTIAPAIQLSYLRTGFDRETFVFGDQISDDFIVSPSSSETIGFSSSHNLDISTGFILFDENFWIGISSHHLTEPTNYSAGNTSLLRKYSMHSGYVFTIDHPSLKEELTLAPSINVISQGPFLRMSTNVVSTYHYISLGSGISNINVLGSGKNILNSFVLIGYSDEHFKVGYSYDFTINGAVGFGGAHEISLGILLNYDNNSNPNPLKHKKIPKVSCPKF